VKDNKDVLKNKCFALAVRIVRLAQWLQTEKNEYTISKQILRSGTAIGALESEANYAQSKLDFISKMSIALKEANETRYWIQLFYATDYIEKKMFESLFSDINEIISLLVSTVKTAKKNEK
jgi:four helix bundle protein